MRPFQCQCGARIFFDNVQCLTCQRELGFVPEVGAVAALSAQPDGTFLSHLTEGKPLRKCENYSEQSVCTWMLPAEEPQRLCRACRLNRVVPDLSLPENRERWARIEAAKRRLVYSLDQLGLTFTDRTNDPEHGLAFEFRADTQGEMVLTGHDDGVITLKVDEADPVLRERVRVSLHERYRSLLGHLRHEVGHYFFDRLLADEPRKAAFRELFGDERQDYSEALKRHYADQSKLDWRGDFISAYAQAHPWEDWAENFAHYLHMADTLETAETFGALAAGEKPGRPLVDRWLELTVILNALNRSMGLEDAYPFAIGDGARKKLEFVGEIVAHTTGRAPAPR